VLSVYDYYASFNGYEKTQQFDIGIIKKTAKDMHDGLRQNSVKASKRAFFVAGILIALTNDEFKKD
jgi:hypothetical protein